MYLRINYKISLGLACLSAVINGTAQDIRINEVCAHSMFVAESGELPSADWRSREFDDGSWGKSVLPLGMDTGSDYELPVNLKAQMYGNATILYARMRVDVPEDMAGSQEPLSLTVDYDDAFVLYLNGVEVARNNVGTRGMPDSHTAASIDTHRASNDQGDGVDHSETFLLGSASQLLRPGINTLAVQIVNSSTTSSDLFLDMQLSVGDQAVTTDLDVWSYFVGIEEPGEFVAVEGITSDWIELYSTSNETVDLSGWSLTDDASEKGKWIFPEVTIAPGEFLLVFASGEDSVSPGGLLQASFKLSSSGEYLGLYNASGSVVSEFAPAFPKQPEQTSFGWNEATGTYRIMIERTPGRTNADASYLGVVKDTAFSIDRGFYDEPFVLEITTPTEGASIVYTTDGSRPTDTNGIVYTGPIDINTTSIIRAYARREDYLPTNVDTHTYIFVNDVIRQDNAPEGFPATLKTPNNQPDLLADYEMDPEVTEDPLYKDKLRAALLSIPSISLVTDIDNLYDRDTGLYMNPLEHGALWERPVSIELIYPSGKEGFQADAGLRIQGGHTRSPFGSPKHSFRVAFRSEYGPSKLDFRLFSEPTAEKEFDTLILRAHGNQSWTHHNGFRGDNRTRAQYIRDQFAKDLQGLAGGPQLHNSYAFLYLNGVFWGLYNPTERPTAGYGETYWGGDKEDYDSLNSGEVKDGNSEAWDSLMALIDTDLSDMGRYQQVAELLDLTAFADYMQINHWGGNEDWDDHNYYALRNRLDGKFYFFLWDSEFFFETPEADVTWKNSSHHPGGILFSLMNNPEFRVLFADRIYRNFYNGGPLTTASAMVLWEERTAQVYQALIAESARWGDNRRDTNRRTGPYELYTRDNQWEAERARVVDTIIPVRNQTTLGQYMQRNWFTSIPGPDFSQANGVLSPDKPLIISTMAIASPFIYYTLDGTDPRLAGGDLSAGAIEYTGPITISRRTVVKCRVKTNRGWGPLREGSFHPAGDPADLQTSEVLYAPLDAGDVAGKELEFVEIRNSGPVAISLDQVELSGGVDFKFPDGLSLDPGAHILVVSNVSAFAAQGNTAPIAGEYSGNLSNDGERVTLRHAELGVIQHVVYSNWYPWPGAAATQGHSLVPVTMDYRGLPTQSTAWKASAQPGGSPGTDEAADPGWIQHPSLGWVYSETGETGPGNWLTSLGGCFLYVGSDDASGNWIWFMRGTH